MSLEHMPPSSRPREKLLAHGAPSLSDAELLALLLRTGRQGRSVLQLAEDLLEAMGGLAGLLDDRHEDWTRLKGLGPAKRSELLAVRELSRRALGQSLQQRPAMDNVDSVTAYVQLHLGHRPYECFAVLFLDTRGRLIALEELFQGGLNQTAVHPRVVVERALRLQAAGVILAHNHPSGDPSASAADVQLTERLRHALALVEVRVLDHLIVARGSAQSLAAQGLI